MCHSSMGKANGNYLICFPAFVCVILTRLPYSCRSGFILRNKERTRNENVCWFVGLFLAPSYKFSINFAKIMQFGRRFPVSIKQTLVSLEARGGTSLTAQLYPAHQKAAALQIKAFAYLKARVGGGASINSVTQIAKGNFRYFLVFLTLSITFYCCINIWKTLNTNGRVHIINNAFKHFGQNFYFALEVR